MQPTETSGGKWITPIRLELARDRSPVAPHALEQILLAALLLNLAWTASLFLAPFAIPPGAFAWPYAQYPAVAYHLGGGNQLDYGPIWATFPWYPRIVYSLGDIQCHQLWYRSFWLNGNQMPLDARMTSMYVFANLGLVAAAFAAPSASAAEIMVHAMPARVRRSLSKARPGTAAFLILAVGVAPTAVDGFYQLFQSVTHYESTNLMRVLTGAPAGFVGGLLVGAMLASMRAFREGYGWRTRLSMPDDRARPPTEERKAASFTAFLVGGLFASGGLTILMVLLCGRMG